MEDAGKKHRGVVFKYYTANLARQRGAVGCDPFRSPDLPVGAAVEPVGPRVLWECNHRIAAAAAAAAADTPHFVSPRRQAHPASRRESRVRQANARPGLHRTSSHPVLVLGVAVFSTTPRDQFFAEPRRRPERRHPLQESVTQPRAAEDLRARENHEVGPFHRHQPMLLLRRRRRRG
jgi:hypothetical protein